MNYRTDARPTCTWCSRAVDASALSFDAMGRLTCKACYNQAASKQADLDAKVARSRVLTGKVLLGAIVGLGVTSYAVFGWLPDYRRRVTLEEGLRVQERAHAHVEGLHDAAELPEDLPLSQACDDATLANRIANEPVPWFELDGTQGQLRWLPNQSARFRRIVSSSFYAGGDRASVESAAQDVAALESVGVVAALVWTNRSELESDHGTVVLLDVATRKRLCWAPVTLAVKMNRGHVPPFVHGAGNDGLRTISRVVRLESF